MLNVPFSSWSPRQRPFAVVILFFVLIVGSSGAFAQEPVAPTVERSDIEILRGTDIVQPQTLVYKRVLDGEDPALVEGDSVGVLRVPATSELDAIPYRDRLLGYTVNVQHAMVVADGQVIDVQVSDYVAHRTGTSGPEELFILRPPAEDAFDIAVPDGLDCKRLVPGSDEDLETRGRLYGNMPCKQVPGVETVVDIAAWYDASLTNSRSGMRAQPGPGHHARELRGWMRSLAPRGEQIRFAVVATPPPIQIAVGPASIRLDTIIVNPNFTFEGDIQVETVPTSGFEWITMLGVLQGPNRSGLPGRSDPSRYRANRVKGDVTTTLRWRANDEQRYDLTLFGSTQPTFSSDAPGNHHEVPYGVRLGARFGERDEIGMDLRLEGTFEDDPFQRNTLRAADQRLRLLVGLDHGTLPKNRTHWRLSVGPTYFVDQPNLWETRDIARQLGYTVDGELTRQLRAKRFVTLFDIGSTLSQSWGYISDTGNNNLDLSGRLSLKPRFRLGSTYLAVGPALHYGQTKSNYATLDGFDERNMQLGLEMRSVILF